jgi:hypothetical protein
LKKGHLPFFEKTLTNGGESWPAADAPVGFCAQEQEAGQGAGCGPGGPPHQNTGMIERRELLRSAAGLLAVSAAAAPPPGKRPLFRRLSVMIGGYFGRNVPLEEKLKKLASINYPAWKA